MTPIKTLSRAREALLGAYNYRRDRRDGARLEQIMATLVSDLSADEVVDLLFSAPARVIQPWQIREEMRSLAALLERRRPKTILEIGTADGGTLFAHCRLAADDAVVISLDLPKGEFGGGYDEWRIPLFQSFARGGQRLELIRADSHDPATADRLASILNGRQLDYAFIDGDHTYEGVRQDFELCRTFAANDAVIAFHDIAEHPPETNCRVRDFWREVRDEYRHEEFVVHPEQGCYGIGVVFLGGGED